MAQLGGGVEAHARLKQYENQNSEAGNVRQSKKRRLQEESVLTSTEEGVYQPKTKETRAVYEAMLSVIQQRLGGQPLNIVSGATDEILAVLNNDTLKNPDKKKDIEKLLNPIPGQVFDQLVSIGRLIIDFQDGGGDADGNNVVNGEDALVDDVGVAVEFENLDIVLEGLNKKHSIYHINRMFRLHKLGIQKMVDYIGMTEENVRAELQDHVNAVKNIVDILSM
ncbi:hypothetical protein Tco_1060732 [Tanacetum coccineum]